MSTSRRGRRGQTSLEFLAMFTLAMLLFASFYAFFAQRQAATVQVEQARTAEAVADRVGFELDLALAEGGGFSRTVTLRPAVGGTPYTVSVAGGTVTLMYGDRTVTADTAVRSITGTVQPGTNTIHNQQGRINVTQP